MPDVSRILNSGSRQFPDDNRYFLVSNNTASAFPAGSVLVLYALDGSGVFDAKLAAASTTAEVRDGLLAVCPGPIAVGSKGAAIRRAVLEFNTAAAASASVPVYLSATPGALTLTPSVVPRAVGLVLGTPAAAGYVLFDPDAALATKRAAYSTTETPTGDLWTNGSPIYRKVLTIAAGGGAGTDVAVALGVTVAQLVRTYGTVVGTGGFTYPLPMSGDGTNTVNAQLNVAKTTMNIIASAGFDILSGQLIVEYTK